VKLIMHAPPMETRVAPVRQDVAKAAPAAPVLVKATKPKDRDLTAFNRADR
jgi:hypothetical protein